MMMSAKRVAARIDHTLLKPDATQEAISRLCVEALEYGFASVCVNPYHVPFVASKLLNSGVKTCSVVGFPLGATSTAVKVFETRQVVLAGALEVDMVLNLGALKSKMLDEVAQDVRVVVETAKGLRPQCLVKVIIETCLLSDAEKDEACALLLNTGADFVKTSTGFSSGGATIEDVARLRRNVGDRMLVKASGGVKTYQDLHAMIQAGADRIGTSNGVQIMQEVMK